MPNLTAREMLLRLPVRMAAGGEARGFSDDEVKQFIDSTYAQFGGPGVKAHKAIADAMAQFGVGVNQVARVSGFTPREVEAEFMGQRAGARPVLDDPTGTAAGMSAAYRAAAQAGGQQTVDDYYANLRKDAAAYLANPNAPTGVDAYNLMIESGISTSDLRNAGVAEDVLNKIFSVKMPIIPEQKFTTPAGMTSAYERSPDLAFESQRLTALGQDGRGILDKQGRDYIANLQQGGIDAGERAQMLEYATERGYSFDDLLKAGVDPNVLFTRPQSVAPPPPFPDPVPYTPITVYQPITPQPDIFAAGQPALDPAFRDSSPRTAILDAKGRPTGQFDYSPAAKLRPATGSGFTFTPPSITTRPRTLLSPREIAAYGGLTSTSQRFAQNRQSLDNHLRKLRQSTPALNDITNYNRLRNMMMSGFFDADPRNPSDPLALLDSDTIEAQNLQRYLAGMPPARAATPNTIIVEDGMTGTDVKVEAPVYGGLIPFSKGGAVKKSEGSAKDELARFAEGGAADAEQLRRQLKSIDNTSSTRTPEREPTPEQTESAQMLERLLAATPVERAVFESTGMEPGLNRASILPFAGTREEGNLQIAAPGFVYDAARAFVTPGMAARGQRVSDEDILNTAMNVMGGGVGASRVAGPRIALDETLLGMAVRSSGDAADVVEEVPSAARQMLDEVAPPAAQLDMSQEARMQRAAEQGYTDRLTHSSSEVFAGSSQAEEAMGYMNIPIQTEFKKTFGGIYFAPEGSLSEDIFSKNPFGGSAEYLLNKGNNFNANYKNMSEAQKKELTEIIGSVVDADDIDNAFDVFTDGDFYQTYGRKAQDNLMNAFSRRGYDSVTFPDNLAMGDMTQSTVVFNPSNIRSVNAAFDPSELASPVITKAKGGAVTSSRRMLDGLYRTNAKGQRFANGGEARVGGSAPAVAGRTGRAAQLAAQRAEEPKSESRTMLERLGRFASLDTPPEMGLGETAADIGMGFLPVVGTAQGARDFERARRDEDNLGMLLSAASMIPVAGGVIKLGKTGASAARKAVDELSEIFAENPLNPREMVTSGAGATVYPMGGALRLSDIRTFDPGKGNASQMLRSILEVADKNEVPVELTAQNYSGKGLTTPQLVDWYKRRGFEVVEDLGEDGVDMTRQPRGVTGELPGAARQGIESPTPTPAVPTQTPEFKSFFGESKVVNDAGRPLQVFHGTNVDFDQFATDVSLGRKRFYAGELGTWFGSTPEVANSFARGVITPRERGVVYPVYLNIKNPKVYDSYEDFLGGMQGRRSASTVKKELQKQGFDGIQIKNSTTDFGGLRDDWVAFKPTQIKSAVGNVGTFDPTNPVITKAKGGLATKSNVERVRNDNRRYL